MIRRARREDADWMAETVNPAYTAPVRADDMHHAVETGIAVVDDAAQAVCLLARPVELGADLTHGAPDAPEALRGGLATWQVTTLVHAGFGAAPTDENVAVLAGALEAAAQEHPGDANRPVFALLVPDLARAWQDIFGARLWSENRVKRWVIWLPRLVEARDNVRRWRGG